MNKQKSKLPKIGARIIKSAVGSALCITVYFLRKHFFPDNEGIPFYSILAVLWCMQPYDDSTKSMAKQRLIGTVTGAVYGLIYLLAVRTPLLNNEVIGYYLACAMVIPIIYTTVIIHKKNASFFSCVVFMSIAINHGGDVNPYIFVLNRAADTLIGIVIGVGLNTFHLPVEHDNGVLYVSGIDSVLVSKDDTMTPYSKVELNRLISEGALFTVSTERTPAALMTLMNGVDLKLPVIAMDGAVLYDIKENRYLDAVPLEGGISRLAEGLIDEYGMHCFVNVLLDNTLIIYYGELKNKAESELVEALRRSPYRNYTQKEYRSGKSERVIYLMVLDENEKIAALNDALCGSSFSDKIRVTVSEAAEYSGYSYLKIYSKESGREKMLEKLRQCSGAERVVTFGSIKDRYDVYIDDDGGNSAVRTLKHLYEGYGKI